MRVKTSSFFGAVLLLALPPFACTRNTPPSLQLGDGGLRAADAGGTDAGTDAGAANPDLRCALGGDDCADAGSCLTHVLPDGGYGTQCFAGACDLVAQDCAPGEKCSYVSDGGAEVARGCTAEGTGQEGDPCTGTPTSNTCAKGFACAQQALADGGTDSLCTRYCARASDCTGPRVCNVVLSVQGTVERPMLCGVPPPECDALAQDCAQTTHGCYLSQEGTACYAAGGVTEGGACQYANDCLGGSVCVGSAGAGTCHPLCRHPSGTPSCATGTCTLLQGQTEVGVCL